MGRVALSDVVAACFTRPVEGVRIVGIDGPSGSGKSSLTRHLVARTSATLVRIDDFVSWTDFGGWWPRFNDEVVQPLLRGEDAHYRVRDWQNDPYGTSLNGWVTVRWSPLVIFDGVTCTRREVSDFLAYRIWVEAPDDVRLARGIARDGEKERHLWIAWMEKERDFFMRDGTRERADLLVNGTVEGDIVTDGDEVLVFDRPPKKGHGV